MALPLYEKFAQVMEHLCRHDGNGGHGYTQGARWGDGTYETVALSDGTKVQVANGDRDCSSGIISALEAVGVDCHGATYTGNMRECLLATGLFKWVPIDQMPYAQRGDIYLNEGSHTAMCTSDEPDMLCQFSISENGTIYGNQGDQTDNESNFRAYYDYPWDGRLEWINREGVHDDGATVISDLDKLAYDVLNGVYGNGDARKAALGDKYDSVQKRVNELLNGGLHSSGIPAKSSAVSAGTYRVVASSLNVRSRPSLSGEVVANYDKGELIYSIGSEATETNGYIWVHYTAYSGATRYVAIGTVDGSEKYLIKV